MRERLIYGLWLLWRGLTVWLRWHPPVNSSVYIVRHFNQDIIGLPATMMPLRWNEQPWNPFVEMIELGSGDRLPVCAWQIEVDLTLPLPLGGCA